MDILLFGGGGHCKAVIDVIEAEGSWRIAGIVEAQGSTTRDVLGYPVVGYDDQLEDLLRLCPNALVTVGQIKSPSIRQRIFTRLTATSFILPTIVSPLARVARSVRLGPGTVVMHYAQVGPDATVGANSIINTRALVEHDAAVGSHCHVATTAVLNGHVVVGDGTLIGSGAICREGITIGANCLVAMGSRVRKPVTDGTLYLGDKSR
jgi:sugar O-acyltransferase (sialic acid O-acetyltransferase NeuD family)